jgi:hypothetical protein
VNSVKPLVQKAIFLVLTCALLALWMMPANTEIVCSGRECQSSAEFSGSVLKGSLNQTFEIEVRVSPNSGENFIGDYKDKNRGIGLSWNKQQQMLMTVPMRYGSSTEFGYTTPKNLEFKSIRIRIEKSESVYIFVDGKIAYTHRYENSPFFINSAAYINTPEGAGKVSFTTKILEQNIEKKSKPFSRVLSIILILGLFAFATESFLRKILLNRSNKLEIEVTSGKSLYKFVGISWLLTILAWIRNPIDTTGANNPGPFAPIGAAFSDFYQLAQLSQFDRPYDLGGTNYPPLGILFLRLISLNDPNNLSFFPIAGVMLGTLYFLFVRSSNKKIAGLIFLASFPFVFGVIRGNLDLLAIFLIWISVLTWEKEKYIFAATAMAFAIALKIWPIVFLLLFLKKKNRLLYVSTSLLVLLLTIFASFVLGYSNLFEIADISTSILFGQGTLGSYAFQNTFSFSSLLFFGHIALMARNPLNISQFEVGNSLVFVNGFYSLMVIFLLLGGLIYLFFKAKNVATEFLILSGVVLLIPTQSFTYRALIVLLYFYLRSDVELVSGRGRSRNPAKILIKKYVHPISLEKIRIWSTIPLFAPTAFYFIPGTQFSTASLFQPLGLLVFIGLSIYKETKSNSKVE